MMDRSIRIVHLVDSTDGAVTVKQALDKGKLATEIKVAGNRQQFMEALTDFSADIILSEYALPDIHCAQAVNLLKQKQIDIPFIIVSSAISDDMAEELLLMGADDYMIMHQAGRLAFAILRCLDKYEIKREQQRLLQQLKIHGIVDNIQDVTGKINADEQRQYKQRRLSQAQAIAHLGSWELDLSTDISIWSEETCRICGLSEKDTIQSSASWLSFVHPEDLERVINTNKDALYSAQAADYFHRIIRKDGQIRHLHVQTQSELNNQGQPARLYGIIHDVTEIENSQQALRNSESNLQAIFENTSEGFILTDDKAIVRYFNSKSRYFFELNTGKEIAIGSNLLDAVSEQKRPEFEAAITKVLAGDVWQYEHAYQHSNGEKKWFNITVNPVYENHLITGFSLVMRDITDHRLAQDMLQRSEANLNAIMNNTDALIYSLDTDFKYIICNHAHKTMMKERYGIDVQPGYDIRESLSKFDPGAVQQWRQINNRALNGEVLKFENEVSFDGTRSYLKYAIHPIRENDAVTGIACFVNDITKEKQADEKVLKALEEKYVILESIGDGFYALDKNWIVTYWNKKAEILLNCPKEAILGQSLWDVFADVIDTELYHAYHRAVKQNTIQHFELYYERDNSWFEVTAYPSASGLSVYFRDITKRKESETRLNELNQNLTDFTNELIKSNKGLEQFSYIVSHNLRAPLANIIGLAGLITQEGYTDQVKEELLNGILVNVNRLDDVITDLNTILQVKKEVSEKRELVNLQELVDEIRLSIRETIENEQVTILTDFSTAPELFTLRSYLHSIFFNLIINSIKFRQPDQMPVIQIKSNLDRGKVSVSFLDNGLGIDLLKKGDQLFGLYKRFHHHVEGKGMGLFMTKTQVEMLGGRITVDSKVNQGTEFKI
ncbi:PAS domain S-box protein [Dyadobacter sandarakinus]|uniref:histidine kinase n=1 Tax=Dyadobacter sandarakinus TaxID=2747268 RepID=A0ABX7I1S4_9BACT|nr:PAS domain S-box protein [Dyadobacter sandarakinus]QRR00032.1 PAS domain S-box protein [Dyadobacter sandarakinus]